MTVRARPFFLSLLGFVVGALSLAPLPAAGHGSEAIVLAGLQRGGWDLRIRDDGSHHSICLRDGSEFVQLRHRQPGCSQFVVRNEADVAIVQYTCRGNGYGRTTIRRESARLVQIESQGISNGVPFAFQGEARHVGSCR